MTAARDIELRRNDEAFLDGEAGNFRPASAGRNFQLPDVPRDSQSFGHPDELSQRSRPHFLHDVAAMDLDRLFCSLQFVGDLFVEHPEYNPFHYFALARCERLIARAQICKLCALLARCPIGINCAPNGVQELLFAEGFGEEFNRTGFHRLNGHRNISVSGKEDDRDLNACFGQFLLQVQAA